MIAGLNQHGETAVVGFLRCRDVETDRLTTPAAKDTALIHHIVVIEGPTGILTTADGLALMTLEAQQDNFRLNPVIHAVNTHLQLVIRLFQDAHRHIRS